MKNAAFFGILMVFYSSVAGQRPGRRFGHRSMEFLTMEERIVRNITAGIHHLRPVEKSSDTVNVTFRIISLLSILEVEEKKGFITFDAWIDMDWVAPNLMWEPSDYDGIDKINLPIDKIWHPDISLYTGGLDAMKYGSAYAIITSSGNVVWFLPASIKAICESNMRNFPFDTKKCRAIFGSSSYSGDKLSLDKQDITVHLRYDHDEWHLYNSSFVRNVLTLSVPYHSLSLKLFLKRKSTFFSYVYISPMVLIALMSPFMFLLPYQQSQRFSLGMYYMSIICLLLGAMIISAVNLNMAEKMSDPPQILKMIIGNGLGSILLLKRTESKTNLVEEVDEDEIKAKKQDGITWKYIATVLDRFFFFVYIVLTIILSIAFTVPR